MIITTVAFFGHRKIYEYGIETKLENIIADLIRSRYYVEFLVGRNGEFDRMASSVIRRAQRSIRNDNSSHILCLPYVTAEYKNNVEAFENYYDEIEILNNDSHFKAAIGDRNKAMIDRADILICYVTGPTGGAAKALHFAGTKHNKIIINLAN